jgi:hypothetical protein
MKKWVLRILSTFLTFTLGLGAASIVRFILAPATKLRPVYDVANIQIQFPPPQIAEETQPTDETDEVMQPHPVSISPYEIKLLVDQNNKSARQEKGYELNFEPIWKQLGIKPEASRDFDGVCNGNCEAELISLELDGKSGKETLVRLYKEATWEFIYLIFKKANPQSSKAGWIFLGYIYVWVWYEEPQLRVVSIGTNRWLVIRHCAGHGSNYHREDDDWYEVSDGGVVLALSYYASQFGGMNPTIDSRTKVIKSDFRNGVASVVVQVSDTYVGYDSDSNNLFPLWTNRMKVTLIKQPGISKFVPDFYKSEMSAESICDLTSPDESCHPYSHDTKFLQYNYRELARLAGKGNFKQKEWLRNYLDICGDSLEKQSLQKAMEGARP